MEETENQTNQIAIQVMNAFFTLLYAEEEVRITQNKWKTRLRLKKIEREYELGKSRKAIFSDAGATSLRGVPADHGTK